MDELERYFKIRTQINDLKENVNEIRLYLWVLLFVAVFFIPILLGIIINRVT